MGLQLLFKMHQQRPAVVVGGEGVDEFGAVLAVQLDFVVDGRLVAVQLLLIVPVVPAVLSDAEVLDVSHVVTLGNGKVRGVGLVSTDDIIFVRLLVSVVNLVEIKEVRNLDFLGRAQCFVCNGNAVAGAFVDDLLRVLAHISLERGEVCLGDVVEEGIEVIALVWSVKVAAEEEDEFVHQLRLLQDVALKVVVDDVEEETTVPDVLSGRILLPEDSVAGAVEGGYRALYAERLVDLVPQLANSLVGEGNHQNLLRIYVLTLYQVPDLGGHCGCLSGTGASNNERVVLIREHHLPLLCVKADDRVNGLEDVVQVVFLRLQMPLQERLVMPADTLRTGFQIGDIRIVPQENFYLRTRYTIGRAVVAERLGRLLILKETVQVRIILH